MATKTFGKKSSPTPGFPICRMACLGLAALASGHAVGVELADAPLFSTVVVPGNLALALSVEWPTATTPAYTAAYSPGTSYLGYFDPDKCYKYIYDSTTASNSYFSPYGWASAHTCSSSSSRPLWSGNYLNWASMQTLDTFRSVMTGGYRSVDTTTQTVLTKTYAAATDSANSGIGNSKSPNKALSSGVSGATPFGAPDWSSVKSRIWAAGTAMYVTAGGDLNGTTIDYVAQNSQVSSAKSGYADPAKVYKLYINVQVCDPGVGIESNCSAYGSSYKPEGLMQKYSGKLRYSAFGYFNDSTAYPQRDGGVMRARMKYIGPTKPVPGSTPVTNATAEWNSSTGIMVTNPDSGDARATERDATGAGFKVSISNSGVMNYLNKFGYSAQTYKGYDPVSELFYTATRYFRNLGNVSAYTSLNGADSATAAKWLDGFPAITTWDDPIAYSCQRNFVLGIGDINCHRDTNLPGHTLTSWAEPTLPPEVAGDATVDVTKATDMVGQLEGKTGTTLGSTWVSDGGGRGNAYYIAGLAYDAHAKDIRPDLSGTQTVSTYWVDVSEDAAYLHKNQYWLAAKYGGFAVPPDFSPYASSNGTSTLADSTWYTTSDTVPTAGVTYWSSQAYSTDGSGSSDKRPDNYFLGNSPEKLKSGLTSAFEKIVSEATSAASTSMSSPTPRQTSSGNANYSVIYNPNTWTSTLTGQTVAYDSAGAPAFANIWEAGSQLDGRAASNRIIVTCCTAGGAALPFTYGSLTGSSLNSRTYFTSFGAISGVSSSSQSIPHYLNYLRGDRSYELANGGPYRTRSHVLGDIVNSKLNAVGAPGSPYHEMYNEGYRSFKSAYANRTTVVYVGANDGMMHAFNGSISGSGGGAELFAYIPSFTYGTASTAATSGLASLGNPSSFSHHYLVDGSPIVADVDLARTGGTTNSSSHNWRTILVGGLGKGGKGYYAIDVTDPSSWASESAVAGEVLWEFTNAHMGYSFGDATIVKTPEFGWTVILPSGYNNDDGNGYLFFINPRSGALLKTITFPGTSAPLDLANVTAYVPDYGDFTADALYATDLQGHVWRVDLTKSSGSYTYTAVQFASLTDASGVAQPITTKPLVEADPNTGKRYVLVGTGQLLSDGDVSSSQTQTFYAIIDGKYGYGSFYTASTLPSSVSFPITRSKLTANTDLSAGISATSSQPMGWYFDLASSGGIAERINVQPVTTSDGIVGFAANLPNGQACSPAGTSRVFAISFADGITAISNSAGSSLTYVSMAYAATDIAFRSIDGTVRFYAGSTQGDVNQIGSSYPGATSYKRLNWREVPTAD